MISNLRGTAAVTMILAHPAAAESKAILAESRQNFYLSFDSPLSASKILRIQFSNANCVNNRSIISD
jgi:hypothetical protein